MTRDVLRSRFGDEVHRAVKDVALAQIERGGPEALSVNAIGRELGVSGPALYRYYAGRDELLTDLIVDAYDELTAVLRAADHAAPTRTARDRLTAIAHAYRRWACEFPHRYRLLFRAPVIGYDAHATELVRRAEPAMDVLVEALRDHAGSSRNGRTAQARAVIMWSRLHGLVGLEIDGNFRSMGIDPEDFYVSEVLGLLDSR